MQNQQPGITLDPPLAQEHQNRELSASMNQSRISELQLAQVEKERSLLERAIATCRDCGHCAPLVATALKEQP